MTDRDNSADAKISLEARIAASLERGCVELDPQVRRRLDQIRSQALDSTSGRTRVLPRLAWSWKSIAATLAAAAVVLTLVIGLVDQPPEAVEPPMTADLDLLTDPHFELAVEDPEFVAWIVEVQPDALSKENSG